MRNRAQTLRVTHKEMPTGDERIPEALYELLLSFSIKVDHHVAAEDQVKWLLHGPLRHEIEPSEMHEFPHLITNAKDVSSGRGWGKVPHRRGRKIPHHGRWILRNPSLSEHP